MATSQSMTKTDPGKNTKKKRMPRAYELRDDSSDSSVGSDRSADDVVMDKFQVWNRPNGKNPDVAQYRGWLTWTPGQWAWEFLRRNPDFQYACGEAVGSDASKQLLAEKFHLTRFKDYREGYDNSTALFARTIKVFPHLDVFKDRLKKQTDGASSPGPTKRYAPRDNEVVITFRLEPGTHVGTTNLTRQLEQARRKLKAHLSALRKARSYGSGAQTLDPEDLFKKLRSIDLETNGLTMAEIGDELNLVKGVRSRRSDELEKRLIHEGSKFKREAERLSRRGYMKLAVAELP
jgi:hypothetical protein